MGHDFGNPNGEPDDLDPCEEPGNVSVTCRSRIGEHDSPDDPHTANLRVRSDGSTDNYGYCNAESQRQNVDKVASDNAEIEDLVVNPAHAIDVVLLPIITNSAERLALGVELLHASAKVMVARLLIGGLCGGDLGDWSSAATAHAGRGRRAAGDRLEWDVNGCVVGSHVAGIVAQRVETLTGETMGRRPGRLRGVGGHLNGDRCGERRGGESVSVEQAPGHSSIKPSDVTIARRSRRLRRVLNVKGLKMLRAQNDEKAFGRNARWARRREVVELAQWKKKRRQGLDEH